MGSKLQRNAIISGYINSYCLVCECHFETDEDTGDHINKADHAEKLKNHPYLEKYNDNHIRKVSRGYFCEFCGLLLATAAKVSLHVQDKGHYERKGMFLLRRPSGSAVVIAFEELLICEQAWHSMTEDTCAICNEEFTNENIHKTESSHLLKLVQTKVEFGANNTVYRKTDETSFQCLTCNSVFALDNINEHFNDDEHVNTYEKCRDDFKKYVETKAKEPEIPKNETKKQTQPKHTELPKQTEKVETKTTVNLEAKTEVDNNHNNIDSTTKEDKTETKNNNAPRKPIDAEEKVNECKEIALTTDEKPLDEATVYANENNLTYNTGNTNAFCRICETKLPASFRSMKEHVNGKEHKNRLAKSKQAAQKAKTMKPQIYKKTMRAFSDDDVVNIQDNMFNQDVVIKQKYCLTRISYLMITKIGGRFRCQTCEVNMFSDDIEQHVDTSRHERAMQHTPVVTSLPDTELVREVRTGIYHCGYCNLIIPSWEEVDSHLQAREHKENKDECAWRLQRHLPSIVEHRRRQELEFMRMIMMGRMFH